MRVGVLVKPGSKKGPMVVPSSDSELIVYLHEKAHDGEANAALVAVLAKHFGVAKSCVSIVGGHKSKKKIVEVIC